jgi:hypothetical protein
MTLGRTKEHTVILDEELAKRMETKASNQAAKAASKRRPTWADKRAKDCT